MIRTRVLWSRLAWPLLLACGFLIFVSACSIRLVITSQSNSELMNRELQLENKLWRIVESVRVAESEQRGYLLTRDPDYLGDFRTMRDAAAAAVGRRRPGATTGARRTRGVDNAQIHRAAGDDTSA